MFRCPQSLAVSIAGPFSSTKTRPGRAWSLLHSWASIVSPGRLPAIAPRRVARAVPLQARISSGSWPFLGLTCSRWENLACWWSSSALAGVKPLSATSMPWGVDLKAPMHSGVVGARVMAQRPGTRAWGQEVVVARRGGEGQQAVLWCGGGRETIQATRCSAARVGGSGEAGTGHTRAGGGNEVSGGNAHMGGRFESRRSLRGW